MRTLLGLLVMAVSAGAHAQPRLAPVGWDALPTPVEISGALRGASDGRQAVFFGVETDPAQGRRPVRLLVARGASVIEPSGEHIVDAVGCAGAMYELHAVAASTPSGLAHTVVANRGAAVPLPPSIEAASRMMLACDRGAVSVVGHLGSELVVLALAGGRVGAERRIPIGIVSPTVAWLLDGQDVILALRHDDPRRGVVVRRIDARGVTLAEHAMGAGSEPRLAPSGGAILVAVHRPTGVVLRRYSTSLVPDGPPVELAPSAPGRSIYVTQIAVGPRDVAALVVTESWIGDDFVAVEERPDGPTRFEPAHERHTFLIPWRHGTATLGSRTSVPDTGYAGFLRGQLLYVHGVVWATAYSSGQAASILRFRVR